MDDPATPGNVISTSTIGEFTWPDEIEVGAYEWQQTKIFPFPHLQLTDPPNPDDLSTDELRLLFHLCILSKNLEVTQSTKFTIWTHKMAEYAIPH